MGDNEFDDQKHIYANENEDKEIEQTNRTIHLRPSKPRLSKPRQRCSFPLLKLASRFAT